MDHRVTVRDRAVTVERKRWLVQNGIGVDYLVLDLDEEFQAMESIVVTLVNSSVSSPAVITYTGESIRIPERMLEKPGMLYVTVTGYRGEDERVVTKAMRDTDAAMVIPSGELGVEPTSEEDSPDVMAHVASLETKVSALTGIIDAFLGITTEAEGEATDEERLHIAETMYAAAMGAVEGVRPIPAMISRAKLNDEDVQEHDYLYPEWEAGRVYEAGDVMRYRGRLYRLGQRVTSAAGSEPGVSGAYSLVGESAQEHETWRQPFGAHDAYALGAIVIDPTDGKAYRSTMDGNVYGPPSGYPICWELYA